MKHVKSFPQSLSPVVSRGIVIGGRGRDPASCAVETLAPAIAIDIARKPTMEGMKNYTSVEPRVTGLDA